MFNTSNWLAYGATSNKFNNTYIQGILDICGNIVLRNGGFSLPNGDVSMNGNLYVGLDTTMRGNVNIQGNLVVNERVLQTLSSDPSYNTVNGYYALAENVQPIVSRQTAYDIGQNWQPANSGVLLNTWRSVCWSPELRIFCAVAKSGTTNQCVMISSDGLNWINATSGVVSNQWNSICWAAELGIFCAVAITGTTNNRVMISSDGLNWSNATSGVLDNSWYIVCWAAEIGKFCAVADSGTGNNRVMVSSDGKVWVNATSGVFNYNIRTISWSPELGIFCMLSYSQGTGNDKVRISRDGLNWTNSGASGLLSNWWTGMCWSAELGIFCAVSNQSSGSSTVMISNDGLTWKNNGLVMAGTDSNWGEVIWARELGLFMTVRYNIGANVFMISSNGLTWISNNNGLISDYYRSLCWSPELSTFCIVSESTNYRAMITNQEYRLPTTKSLKTLLNDGNTNINIRSTASSSLSNYGTSQNIIKIGDKAFFDLSNNIVFNEDWDNTTKYGHFDWGLASASNIIIYNNSSLRLYSYTAFSTRIYSSITYNSLRFKKISFNAYTSSSNNMNIVFGFSDSTNVDSGFTNRIAIELDGRDTGVMTMTAIKNNTVVSTLTTTADSNITYLLEIEVTPYCVIYSYTDKTNNGSRISYTYTTSNINEYEGRIGITFYSNTASQNSRYVYINNIGWTLSYPSTNNISIGSTDAINLNKIQTSYLNVEYNNNNIGMGKDTFPALTTGFQNIGMGNAIATSMTTGDNNVFIGNGVATSTTSTGNTVAIGTNAGRTNTTGINNTYLGAFTGANAGAYSNSTAIGYGATITASNQITLGTANETTNIDGNLIVNNTIQTTNLTVSGTTSLISDITLPGNLIVNNTTPAYNVNSGSLQLQGGAGILGNVFINQNLSVAQVSTFSGNVSLNGIQNTFTGDVSMNGNLQVNKTLIFNGNVVINGNTTFSKDVSMNGNLQIPNNATVGGDVSMNGNLTVGKISTFIGNVSISGFSNLRDASMNGNLYVSGETTLVGNVNIQGNLVVNKRVLQTLSSDPSYNSVNGYYALAENVQPIVSKQTAYDIGQYWVNAKSGVLANNWYNICWSSELGLFCAIAWSGTANERIMVSNDGLNWRNAVGDISNNNWSTVCWAPQLSLFCAAANTGGTNDRVIVSSNGLNWSTATNGVISISWSSVCWSPELSIFCAVASGGGTINQRVMLSRNGLNWSNATSGALQNGWTCVCWAPELRLFCAVANSGGTTDRVMVSSDGYNWRNAISGVISNNWTTVCWAPKLGLFCAVAGTGGTNDRVMVSSDGLNWVSAISGVLGITWGGICWSEELGLFCAIAYTGGTTNENIMVSSDGLNWRNAISGVLTIRWNQVCWSPELSSFCAVSQTGTTNQRVMITNQSYRLPTTKSIQTLLNDGNYNINIASTPSGNFPNFRTTATGPNLISIGNGNYKLVAGALRDSIAIGNTILNGSNPNGYGIIGMGQNVFPALTTGFQNIGIGNAIATSMTTGYNNVFIGNSVATSTSSTGNTVAIGTAAGRRNITGINNTYLGAFTDASFTTYSNSTAIGYGAVIGTSNEIVLGTITEHIRTPGNPYWLSSFDASGWISNATIVAIRPGSAVFSNRITVYNTYYLLVPEFAYGLYLVHITYNLNQGAAFNTFQLYLYQYAFANATTANVPSGNNPANYFLIRSFETIITGGTTTTLGSSMSASYLFEYASGTTNRAFTFGWLTGALNTTANNDSAWNWVAIHKVA
jgi:hypothetical protein